MSAAIRNKLKSFLAFPDVVKKNCVVERTGGRLTVKEHPMIGNVGASDLMEHVPHGALGSERVCVYMGVITAGVFVAWHVLCTAALALIHKSRKKVDGMWSDCCFRMWSDCCFMLEHVGFVLVEHEIELEASVRIIVSRAAAVASVERVLFSFVGGWSGHLPVGSISCTEDLPSS